ncbi:hypothetical protein [Priestia aryabhattai]|uniref:hypothetical protein n=1 Tax=Priestia aryabhattai TaxID=412384 RepID=UPI0027E58DDA|nr:hypothetical protein [Priestia aryabhattai]MCG0045539.1 hypothetical protein [Priestia aryabhattai]
MTKKKTFSVVLMLFLVLPKLISFNFFFFLLLGYVSFQLLFRRIPFSRSIFFKVLVLMSVILISFISYLYTLKNSSSDAIRDIIYMFYPILLLLAGYIWVLKTQNITTLLRTIVLSGVALSTIHIFKLLINPTVLTESIRAIRIELGNGYNLSVISMSILIYSNYYKLRIFKKRLISVLCICICTLSFALALSRTLTIVLVIFLLFLGWKKVMKINKFSAKKIHLQISILMCSAIIVSGLIYQVAPSKVVTQLGEKFSSSFNEIKMDNYSTITDINHNWRGYEGFRALKEYNNYDTFGKIVGGGLGKLIDLNLTISLAGKQYSKVPIIHNGYMYIVVKSGMVGIFLYLLYIYSIVRTGIYSSKVNLKGYDFIGRLTMAIGITILIITYFNTGMYKPDSAYDYLLIIGCFEGCLYLKGKNSINQEIKHPLAS